MNIEQFQERAAIAEFDGGLTRFEAETLAAREQGIERFQAMQEIRNENSKRNPTGQRRDRSAAARDAANALPRVQPHAAEENRPMLGGHVR